MQNYFQIYLIGIFILGLVVGSFINVVIYRLPLMLERAWKYAALEESGVKIEDKTFNLALPRSHCPHCQQTIPIWANIPLLGYLLLRGKCHYCQQEISWRYPLVELISAITATIVAYQFGITWTTLTALIFTWSLNALTFIDFENKLLPDNITLPLLWLGLIVNLFNVFTSPHNAIIGAVAGYLSLYIIAWLFKKIRGIEGMGHGDFKLLAAIGAWVGWQPLLYVLLFASVLGVGVAFVLLLSKKMHRNTQIPFGPYIAIAGWIALMWGPQLFNWYFHLLV